MTSQSGKTNSPETAQDNQNGPNNEEKCQQWLRDNQEAIENCNQFIEINGLFADCYRVF